MMSLATLRMLAAPGRLAPRAWIIPTQNMSYTGSIQNQVPAAPDQ